MRRNLSDEPMDWRNGMLRATVYTMVNGEPWRREVMQVATSSAPEFYATARTRTLAGGGAPPGASLEFGPIGAPWGHVSSPAKET